MLFSCILLLQNNYCFLQEGGAMRVLIHVSYSNNTKIHYFPNLPCVALPGCYCSRRSFETCLIALNHWSLTHDRAGT